MKYNRTKITTLAEDMENTRFMTYKGMLIPADAPHRHTRADEKNARLLLKKSGALMLRTTFNCGHTGNRSFYYVVKQHFGGLEELSPRDRNKVRHALRFFDIHPSTAQEIGCNGGYDIYKAAYSGYGTTVDNVMDCKQFQSSLSSEYEYWICREKNSNRPAAYAEIRMMDDACEIRMIKADPEFTHNGYYVLYGLYYEICRHYLSERSMKYVSNGSRSITAQSNVHEHLIRRFHFEKMYCDIRIIYRHWFGLLVKIAYPFRGLFHGNRIKSVLRQEAMQRECLRMTSKRMP